MENYERELAVLRKLYKTGIYEPDFYKKKLSGIDSFRDYNSFAQIPFTYKRELRNTSVMERTTTELKDIYGVFSSSGTTGEKTFYVYNRNDKSVHEEFVNTLFS